MFPVHRPICGSSQDRGAGRRVQRRSENSGGVGDIFRTELMSIGPTTIRPDKVRVLKEHCWKFARLTPSELRSRTHAGMRRRYCVVFYLLRDGYSLAEIAEASGMSYSTVENITQRIALDCTNELV